MGQLERATSIAVGLAAVGVSLYLAIYSGGGPASALMVDASATTVDAAADAQPIDETDSGATLSIPSFAPIDRSLKSVRIGVVILQFAGAQRASAGARSKSAAWELAQHLAPDAKTDFHGAVQRGDNGSTDDLGRIGKGILEPNVEAAIFSLPSGGVSDVLETPTGFWIVKRLD